MATHQADGNDADQKRPDQKQNHNNKCALCSMLLDLQSQSQSQSQPQSQSQSQDPAYNGNNGNNGNNNDNTYNSKGSFWDQRHPSLGLPVGCLLVPKRHMSAVQSVLKKEGKAGRGQWIRQNGTIPCPCRNTFQIHLTIFGAVQVEMQQQTICLEKPILPHPLEALLQDCQIKWNSGARLSQATATIERPIATIAIPTNKETIIHNPTMNTNMDKKRKTPPPRFRFAELFAGIGGFHLGLEPLGGECAFASEMDSFAAATYALNFESTVVSGDITAIATSDLPTTGCDLVVGGFPCQSFSNAGHQNGISDATTFSHNGRLYLEVCRVLHATQAKAFLLENVANLYTLDGGTFQQDFSQRQPGEAYKAIVQALEMCGYTVQTNILNAKDYGVPQYRDRLFLVGFRDPKAAERFVWPVGAATTTATTTLRSVLEPIDGVAVKAAKLTSDQYKTIQPYLEATDRSCRKARLDGIARTLMASYRSGWQKHSEFLVVHKDGVVGGAVTSTSSSSNGARFYTAREAARIMGFPETYVIPGHPTRELGGKAFDAYQRFYHQIGNAVCPSVIQAAATGMLEAMHI